MKVDFEGYTDTGSVEIHFEAENGTDRALLAVMASRAPFAHTREQGKLEIVFRNPMPDRKMEDE